MSAGTRRAIACAAILIYLTGYVWLAVSIGTAIGGAPWYAQLAFYALAGVCWALPLKPLFSWMARGS